MLKGLGIVATLLMLSQANAAHYGMAGCGLGSLVFQDQPGMIQIVASTLNNLVSPQTSAITSGTSGCYEAGGSNAQVDYIEMNMPTLKEDIARGQGETLDGLMTLLNCSQKSSVQSELKNSYQQIFQVETAEGVLRAIRATSSVQQACGNTLG